MNHRKAILGVTTAIALVICTTVARAQSETRAPDPARTVQPTRAANYTPPSGVDFRPVTIMSDGIRLHGEVFTPADVVAGAKLPAVIMAHGWGGVAAYLRTDASDIARAGYYVLVFDYRGWGESGSPVILVDPEALHDPGEAASFTARVQPLREYINPLEQAEDWLSAIDWIMGEPQVDHQKVGLRGSSYSGGHVVYVAANDPRVRAVVSQVGGFDSRPPPGYEAPGREMATRMARGEIGYPAPRASAVAGLIGTPIGHKGERYSPVLEAAKVKAPTLVIITELEEYGGNPIAELAYARLQGPKELKILAGATHYAVYSTERDTVVKLAIDWFDNHLKGS